MKTKLILIGILIAIAALTLYLRAGVPFDSVFVGSETRYIDPDSYHHMRLADSLNANFPNDITFDPYLGDDITVQPLFHWLIVLLGKVFGNMDAVGAWLPAICGLLLIIPAFFIGKTLFKNNWAGIAGAFTTILIPGEIQGRTMLGFADHHCLEILFSVLILMFLIMGLTKSKWYWTAILPLLVLYWFTWSGTPLIAGIIAICLLIWLGMKRKWGWLILCFAVPAVAIFSLLVISPQTFNSLLQTVVHQFSMVFSTGGAGGSIMEAQMFSLQTFWTNFNLIGVVALCGLIYLTWRAYKDKSVPLAMFLAWTVILLILTIFQRRFAYYLGLPVGICCGYLVWFIVSRLSTKKLTKHEKKASGKQHGINWIAAGISGLIIIAVVMIPNINAQRNTSYPYQITPAWEECLYWLRNNSPEPFSDPDFYYADYDIAYRQESVEKGDLAKINSNAYRVLSWWDYGHWIVRLGRRPVACSPAGGQTVLAAQYLMSDGNIKELDDKIQILRVRYVIVDYYMVTGKFYAIPLWAGKDAPPEETLVFKLYYGNYNPEQFREVFESSQKYQGQAQVKVFEVLNW